MNRWPVRLLLISFFLLAFPFRSPAPLVFRPGEGWVYEPVGSEGNWVRLRAKDQLEVAQTAFDGKDYSLALRAAKRVVTIWPLSDYAPQGAYLVARSHEALKQDEMAFKEYQKLLENYPKSANYQEVLQRQFAICNRFLAGQRFKLWGYIPTFPSMDKTVTMYERLIKNGPYSDVAPQAQLNIGAAREKQMRFLNDNEPYVQAAKAYERAADRYYDRPKVASEASFREGLAYEKQARTAEYDQGTAIQAIDTFTDFMTRYPDDPRVPDAKAKIDALRHEQSFGDFKTAMYYEHLKAWKGATMYYNAVANGDPSSPYANLALQRIAALKPLIANSVK